MTDAQPLEGFHHPFPDLCLGPPHLQWAKGHLIEHRRIEKLRIRALKYQTHLTAKGKSKPVIGETLFSELLAPECHAACLSEIKAVQQPQKGRFSGTICAQ